MITQLTPEQWAKIPKYQKKWYDKAHSLEWDEKKASDYVDHVYGLLGKKPPTKLFFDSPFRVQIVANLLKKTKKEKLSEELSEELSEQLRDQLWDQLSDQLWDQLSEQLSEQLRDQLWDQLSEQLREELSNKLSNKLSDKFSEELWEQLSEELSDKFSEELWDQLSDQLWDQLSEQLEYFPFEWWGSLADYGFIAFYDFLSNEVFPKKIIHGWKEYLSLADTQISQWLSFEGIAIISKPPTFMNYDENNKLHCTNDYALMYADGYKQAFIHGIPFSEELFKKVRSNTITGKEILSLENHEQKAALIQHYGQEKIINEVRPKVLDHQESTSYQTGKPVTYKVIEYEISEGIPYRMVMVECHTEHKKTYIGVPRTEQTKTCKGAIAWTFGLDPEEYCPIIES